VYICGASIKQIPMDTNQKDFLHILIIDDVVYHIGASLKDLGKKVFAFSKMEVDALIILSVC